MKRKRSFGRAAGLLVLLVTVTAVVVALTPKRASTQNPGTAVTFGLEAQGVVVGYFASAEGIGSETDVIERKVAAGKGAKIIMKLPGALKWTDVTLTRGVTSDHQVWQWRQMVVDGNMDAARKDFTITAYDQSLSPIAQWNFQRGWPSKVVAAADGGGTLLEALVLVHEGVQRVPVP